MSFLEVSNITKSFGDTEVLKGISFTMERGQVLAIIGSSGSGKTTLLRCLNFLETADGGTIRLGGDTLFDAQNDRRISDSELRARRLRFGLVFQSFNLFPQYSVLRNVTLAKELLLRDEGHLSRAERRRRLDEIDEQARALLKRVGLEAKYANYPCELSGGQRQRAAAARAMVKRPPLLFADEPTGALDSASASGLLDALARANRALNTTILMVTHDPHAASYADRILFFEDGRILSELHRGQADRRRFFENILRETARQNEKR